jgi:hypothetical protein
MDISWHNWADVRRSVQTESTAVIFCCGSNTLRDLGLVFIVYILSCVVYKFFFRGLVLAVDQHLDLAFFRPDHHRLCAHATDHIKRVHRATAQCQLQSVFLHAPRKRLFQLVGDLEEPVRRTQPTDALMRALVVVILDPKRGPLPGLLEAVELGPL